MSVDDVPVDVLAYVIMPFLIENEPDINDYHSDEEEGSEYKMNIEKRDEIRALSRVNKKWRTAMRKCLHQTPKYITMYHLASLEDIVTMPDLWKRYFKAAFESTLESEMNVIRHLITFPFGNDKREVHVDRWCDIEVLLDTNSHLTFSFTVYYYYVRDAVDDNMITYVSVGHSIHTFRVDLNKDSKCVMTTLECKLAQGDERPTVEEFANMCAAPHDYITIELSKLLTDYSRVDDYVWAA